MAELSRREQVALEIFGRMCSDKDAPLANSEVTLGNGMQVIYGEFAAKVSFEYADFFIRESNKA